MSRRAKLGRFNRVVTGLCLSIGVVVGASFAAVAAEVDGSEDVNTLKTVHQGIPHDALYGVCFEGESGFAVGFVGAVLSTSDAGVTWEPQAALTNNALLDVSCHGKSAIAVGQAGVIQVKPDGGEWQLVSDTGTDQRLMSVNANSEGLAVAVGGFGTVMRSRDAGASWETISIDWEAILNDFIEPHIYDVAVFEDNSIMLVGEFELILLSVDGGDSWETLHKKDASLSGIYFSNRQTGYVAGQNGAVLKTVDGGVNWQSLEVPTRENLLDVWAAGSDVVITGIRTLLRSHDAGASWESITEGDVSVKWYQAVRGASVHNGVSHNVVMVGHSGRIVQINN